MNPRNLVRCLGLGKEAAVVRRITDAFVADSAAVSPAKGYDAGTRMLQDERLLQAIGAAQG